MKIESSVTGHLVKLIYQKRTASADVPVQEGTLFRNTFKPEFPLLANEKNCPFLVMIPLGSGVQTTLVPIGGSRLARLEHPS